MTVLCVYGNILIFAKTLRICIAYLQQELERILVEVHGGIFYANIFALLLQDYTTTELHGDLDGFGILQVATTRAILLHGEHEKVSYLSVFCGLNSSCLDFQWSPITVNFSAIVFGQSFAIHFQCSFNAQ